MKTCKKPEWLYWTVKGLENLLLSQASLGAKPFDHQAGQALFWELFKLEVSSPNTAW